MDIDRDELKTKTKNLIDSFNSSLKGVFSDLEIDKVKNAASNFFNIDSSSNPEYEESLRKNLNDQLDFAKTKINDLQERESQNLNKVKNQISNFFQENSEVLTPSYDKLQDLKDQIDEYYDSLDLNFDNIKDFSSKKLNDFQLNAQNLINKAKAEIKEKNDDKNK